MAHFAQLDENNIVIQVIVVNNEDILDEQDNESETVGIEFCKALLGSDTNWKQTSYNSNFRKNFACVGSTYDESRNAFYGPQPFPSWTLNETTCQWESPVVYPDDGESYRWNEDTTSWNLVTED